MALSWNEIKELAVAFSKEWENTVSEEADAKLFFKRETLGLLSIFFSKCDSYLFHSRKGIAYFFLFFYEKEKKKVSKKEKKTRRSDFFVQTLRKSPLRPAPYVAN